MALRKVITKYEPIDANLYIGADGELWVDTESAAVHVGDSSTPGGLDLLSAAPGFSFSEWYGEPNLTTSDPFEYTRIQMQSTTDWIDNGDYGRATLSWHDLNYSQYTHIQADPYGATINLAAWNGPNSFYIYSWQFGVDGTSIPNDLYLYGNVIMDSSTTTQIQATQGTGATGGYTFSGNEGSGDTGMFSPTDGDLNLYSQGNQVIHIAPVTTVNEAVVTLYGALTLNLQTVQPTGVAGMLAMCDGSGWDGGGDGLQHLMCYINGSWHKVV
jgi:hypothetical protein